MTSSAFRLGHVPGVTPDKWVRTWRERFAHLPLDLLHVPAADAAAMLRDRVLDAAILRLGDRTGLHAIPLYTETTVVVAPKDHVIAAADELTPADLADEVLLRPLDDVLGWADPPARVADDRPESTADALKLVAGGLGLLVVPQSLFRLHYRKDLIARPIADAPQSVVALSWLEDETTDPIELFIGIVRGRTVNSTRGRSTPTVAPPRRPAGPRRSKPRRR
ncbi:LysR substrate-binding domain-containing protein [Actinokineospora sp. NPDC004072]